MFINRLFILDSSYPFYSIHQKAAPSRLNLHYNSTTKNLRPRLIPVCLYKKWKNQRYCRKTKSNNNNNNNSSSRRKLNRTYLITSISVKYAACFIISAGFLCSSPFELFLFQARWSPSFHSLICSRLLEELLLSSERSERTVDGKLY